MTRHDRTRRAIAMRRYWRTVRSVAHRTDRRIAEARVIVRTLRRREISHTAIRESSRRRLNRNYRLELTREKDHPKPGTKGTPRPPARVDYLLSLKFSAGGRSYRRDLIVPALRGTNMADLIRQAKAELPTGAKDLLQWLTPKNIEILEGPDTTRKRAELR